MTLGLLIKLKSKGKTFKRLKCFKMAKKVKNVSRYHIPSFTKNTKQIKKPAESLLFLLFLLALGLLDNSEVETKDPLGEDEDITFNRVLNYFEGMIPLYFPDEFKSLSNDEASCSLAWSCPHFALLTKACCGQSTVEDRKLEDQSHVEFDFWARRNWIQTEMVEWNRIIWLYVFPEIAVTWQNCSHQELPNSRGEGGGTPV